MKVFDRFTFAMSLEKRKNRRIPCGLTMAFACSLVFAIPVQSRSVMEVPLGKHLTATNFVVFNNILDGIECGIKPVLIADYRNSYATPYGDTYESRFGSPRRPYYPYVQNNRNFPLRNNSQGSIRTPRNQSASQGSYGLYSKGSDSSSTSSSKNQNATNDWLNVPTNRPPPWNTKSSPGGSRQDIKNPRLDQNNPGNSTSEESSKSGPVILSNSGGTINMEISHSDYLPSLPPSLHKGSHFEGWSNTKIPRRRSRPGVEKYLIPKWLAGRWQRTKSTETKRVKLPDGKALKTTGTTIAKTVDVFGTYIDSEGKIWQVFNPKQAVGEVDRGTVMDHHRVMKYKIEILGPKTVVVEVTASHLVVTKNKQQIVKSFQDEELNTYTLLKNGKVKTESSVKVFDQLGKPILLTHSVSDVTKIQSPN